MICVVVLTVCIIVYERIKNMYRKVPVQEVDGETKLFKEGSVIIVIVNLFWKILEYNML